MDRGEGVSADEAFALLGNETRIRMLRELWRRAHEGAGDRAEPVPFSELQSAVGARDSGNFSYHLDRLVGPFVERAPEGYVIRRAGTHVVRAILAGTVTDDPSFGPVELDETCYRCGASITVSYSDGRLYTRCTACEGAIDADGGAITAHSVPPAGIADRSLSGVVRAACVNYVAEIDLLCAGVCPVCAGRVDPELRVCAEHSVPDGGLCSSCGTEPRVSAAATCRNCRFHRVFVPVFAAHDHPVVAGALTDRGYDAAAPGFPELCELLGWPAEPTAEGVVYAVPSPDDDRAVRVDATLSVSEAARTGE